MLRHHITEETCQVCPGEVRDIIELKLLGERRPTEPNVLGEVVRAAIGIHCDAALLKHLLTVEDAWCQVLVKVP